MAIVSLHRNPCSCPTPYYQLTGEPSVPATSCGLPTKASPRKRLPATSGNSHKPKWRQGRSLVITINDLYLGFPMLDSTGRIVTLGGCERKQLRKCQPLGVSNRHTKGISCENKRHVWSEIPPCQCWGCLQKQLFAAVRQVDKRPCVNGSLPTPSWALP